MLVYRAPALHSRGRDWDWLLRWRHDWIGWALAARNLRLAPKAAVSFKITAQQQVVVKSCHFVNVETSTSVGGAVVLVDECGVCLVSYPRFRLPWHSTCLHSLHPLAWPSRTTPFLTPPSRLMGDWSISSRWRLDMCALATQWYCSHTPKSIWQKHVKQSHPSSFFLIGQVACVSISAKCSNWKCAS